MQWLAIIAVTCVGVGQSNVEQTFPEIASAVAKSANAFLSSLDDAQRAEAAMAFDDADRHNWHFVPKVRKGLSLKAMNPEQQQLALNLIETALSESGYEKVHTIRMLEDVLYVMEGGAGLTRDKELYYVAVFGTPSDSGTWSVRYEGHHLSLHWTMVEGRAVAAAPQFLGANPAEVRIDHAMKGTRALGAEEQTARQLVHSMDESQRKTAILSDQAPDDILSGTERKALELEHVGIGYADLNATQQEQLIGLLQLFASIQKPVVAKARMDKIHDAGLDQIKFAWMGGLEPGERHYYRIQGPTFVLEYDNTQNDANHVHTVWRDYDGDFGEDLLKLHYQQHANALHPGEHVH